MDVLEPLSGACDATTGIDVVFVHRAESDARSCWHPRGHPEFSVPKRLVRELPYVCAWSLGYDSSLSRRQGGRTLSPSEQATESVRELANHAVGRRPIVFIAHGVGGLLVKHVLRLAEKSGNDDWTRIAERTVGVVFLSTPHFGTCLPGLARWLSHVPLLSRTLFGDLLDHERLEELNDDFLRLVAAHHIRVDAFYETRRSPSLLGLARKVSRESADPRVPGLVPTAVNAHHENVCRPARANNHVFVALSRFVRRCFAGPPEDVFVSYAREDEEAVDAFVEALLACTGDTGPRIWSDRLVCTGDAWEIEILKHIESSRAAVLLVTPAFLDSTFICEVEVPFLRRKWHADGIALICVPFDPETVVMCKALQQCMPGGTRSGGIGSVQGGVCPVRPVSEMSPYEREAFFARVVDDVMTVMAPALESAG